MARKRKRQSKPIDEQKTARLNLMIHPELRDWARDYARRKHTSISGIITNHLVKLRDEEHVLNVEQI